MRGARSHRSFSFAPLVHREKERGMHGSVGGGGGRGPGGADEARRQSEGTLREGARGKASEG